MILVDRAEGNHSEHAAEDQAAIQQQLERLLTSSYFSHSRRIPSFLKFVVEQALSGQGDSLKERTLGIEVFGKDADYDTASDSVVRVTAAELRKRIAQYYQESGHEHELRISLPPGSYIPHFHWPATPQDNEESSIPFSSSPLQKETIGQERSRSLHILALGISLILVGLLAAGVVFYRRSTTQSLQAGPFWTPVLSTPEPVLFCIADQNQYPVITLRDSSNLNRQTTLRSNLTTVVIDDLSPIIRIGAVLQSSGKKYTIKGEGSTNLSDLRNGQTILIGAFDNAWTLRLTKSLHYRFANNPEMTQFGIADSTAPSRMKWVVDRQQQINTNNYSDYAIIARFTDPTTGKLTLVSAGVGLGGTIAAGEFLTNFDDLSQSMRNAGKSRNVEIVLSTQIIDGQPGTPKIEATYFW